MPLKAENVKWLANLTNEDVCLKLNVERKLLELIKRRKLSYFGDIKRHHTIKKEILEGKVYGRRGRDRHPPPRRWEDDVKDWTKVGLSTSTRAVENRDVWRDVTRLPQLPRCQVKVSRYIVKFTSGTVSSCSIADAS